MRIFNKKQPDDVKITSEMWQKAMKMPILVDPSIRNSDEWKKRELRRDRFIMAFKKSTTYPQVRPRDEKLTHSVDKREDTTPRITMGAILWLLASVPICLVIWYMYDIYLSFLTIPIIITLYVLERKHIL